MVHGVIIDAYAVVRTLVVVPVVLILASELHQVAALQHGNVVAEEMIFPIPEARACLLGVHVIWRECLEVPCRLTKGLERAGRGREARKRLRRVPTRRPLPPVAEKAVTEVVCNVGADAGGHSYH